MNKKTPFTEAKTQLKLLSRPLARRQRSINFITISIKGSIVLYLKVSFTRKGCAVHIENDTI